MRITGTEKRLHDIEIAVPHSPGPESTPLRVLVISPIFPPLADAEANCAGKFVQALVDYGVDVTVLFSSDARARQDQSKQWEPLRAISIDLPGRTTASVLERCLLGLRYQTTSWIYWTHLVVRKARELHRQAPFDLIVSRSLPSHAHLAGYWAAAALRIPWVAIVNDPWDFSSFVSAESRPSEWTPSLNWKIWWHRIVARADCLYFPCERLGRFCLRGSQRSSGVAILPHIGSRRECTEEPDQFLIVHSGKLGIHDLTGRSSKALLDGVKGLIENRPAARSRAHLMFVGPTDRATVDYVASQGLEELVTHTGLVSYEQSLEYVGRATVCVVVEGDVDEGIFLPSKLCDYVAARKPILALSPTIGTLADLGTAGYIRCVNVTDSKGTASALTELFDAFQESRLDDYRPPDSLVRRFEAERVVEAFVDSLKPFTTRLRETRQTRGIPGR